MRETGRILAALGLTGLALIWGCGDSGQAPAPTKSNPTATNPDPAAKAGPETKKPAEVKPAPASAPEKKESGEVKPVNSAPAEPEKKTSSVEAPAAAFQAMQLVAVVTEAVPGDADPAVPKGKDYLYQPSKKEWIQDKPYTLTAPVGLPPIFANLTIPASNPLTEGKIALGKQLYFDPRVSKDATVSCATCHNPEKGWTDQAPTSTGIAGQLGGRNSPTVLNTIYGKLMFWDGRAESLEAQAQGPVQNPIEMGSQTYKEIIERLRQIPGYQEQFKKVFGTEVTLDGMAKAIATFERVEALSGGSKYDEYQNGKLDALSESEKRGMVLFGLRTRDDDTYKLPETVVLQKAKCSLCHVGGNFTDDKFHNLGVGWDAAKGEFKDLGRWAALPIGAKNDADIGAFKTPTLRDITKTAPYMHDGGEKTLEAVMELYNKGGHANPYLDKDMKPLKLNPDEIKDVIAFMKALDGKPIKVELPKLPAGPDGKSPDPKAALQAPTKKAAMVVHPPGLN